MTEREDETREQHEHDEGGTHDTSGVEGERGETRTDDKDSPAGASGEGTQSTGNPDAAG